MSLWKAIIDDDVLASIYTKLIELPSKYGFSYPRWEVSIQAMLKERDLAYLNKLRIIKLFELDLNSFLKFIMGKAYPKYEKVNSLSHPESYGAMKGCSAHGAINSVQLALEQSWIMRSPIVMAPKDVTGCFDLIWPEFIKLIQDSKVVPTTTTSAKVLITKNMKRFFQTGIGLSVTSFQCIQKQHWWHQARKRRGPPSMQQSNGSSKNDPCQRIQGFYHHSSLRRTTIRNPWSRPHRRPDRSYQSPNQLTCSTLPPNYHNPAKMAESPKCHGRRPSQI